MAEKDTIKTGQNAPQQTDSRTDKWSVDNVSEGLSKLFPSVVQALTDPSRDIVLIYDMDRRLQYASPSFERLTGYSVSLLNTMNFIDYCHPEDRDTQLAAWDDVFNGKAYQGRFRYFTKQQAVKECLAVWKPVCEDGGRQIGVIRKETEISPEGFLHAPLNDDGAEKYLAILDDLDISYFELDLKGNFIRVNDVVCRNLGYSRDELMGMNYRAYYKPDNIEQIKNIYREIYRTGRPKTTVDYEILKKDGTPMTIRLSMTLMRNTAGEAVGFMGLASDITDRIREEQRFREMAEKYQAILETMEEGYTEADLKGNYTFVNDAACRTLGYTREEAIGMNFRKIHTPDVIQYLSKVFTRIRETGKPELLMDYAVIHKNGSRVVLQSNTALMYNNEGRPVGYRILSRDITEHKKAEEALRESEEKYRTILETIDEGFFENDLSGTYTFLNDAACRLIGYERHEILGKKFWMIHKPDTARYLKEAYSRMYRTGQVEKLLDYEAVRKDGSVRIHQANSVIIRNQAGEITGFRALVRDITEKRKAEEERTKIEQQLMHAQKMESVGRLAGGIAHDFNNMITVILGYAELIKLRLPQDSPFLKDMGEIEKAAIRSRDMTRQLLAFSRKAIIAPKNIDLNSLIVDTQKTILRLLGEDIDLKFYPGNDLWKIKVDPSQIEQVLINLAVNARDSMPQGGKLTIETENIRLSDAYCKMHAGFIPGYYALLGISDEGVGMDKATLQQIFEPFFTTKELGKGTGLGLSTVYGIVKQNNGFINVYSEPGKGTTFKIYIPRSDEEIAVKEEEEEPPAKAATGTILLVEDDNMVRQLTADMLEAIGYKTLAAGSPQEAMTVIGKNEGQIDLIITDVVMPGMSGKELIEKIEAVRPGVPVLYMSGYTTNVIAHRGVLDEGVNFIQKPFSIGDLARKIQSILK